MKKLFLMSLTLCLSLGAMADGGTIDGTQLSKITFDGDQVVLHYKDGTTGTMDMETITIDMSAATSIEERVAITEKAGIEGMNVYNLKGQLVGTSAARLEKGIYIVNGKKVVIR
jgi:hypothetical protein